MRKRSVQIEMTFLLPSYLWVHQSRHLLSFCMWIPWRICRIPCLCTVHPSVPNDNASWQRSGNMVEAVQSGILLSLWWEGMQPLQIRSTQQPCRSAESSQGSVPNKTSLFSIWKFQFSKSEICAFFCSKPRLNLQFTSSNFTSCLISNLFIISSHPGNVWTWQNMNSVVVTMKTAMQPQIMTHSPTDICKRVQRSWLWFELYISRLNIKG